MPSLFEIDLLILENFTDVALYSPCFVSSLVAIGPVVSGEDENVMIDRRIENGQQALRKT